MARTIVLPLDLDHESSWRKALPIAAEFARHSGAQLHVMTVVPDELDKMTIVAQLIPEGHEQKIVDEAKQDARSEGERIIVGARAGIDQEMNQAREKLRKGERFDQIVVASGLETLDTVVHLTERAQDQRRSLYFGSAQSSNDCQAIHAWQHSIDDQRVVRLSRRQKQAILAVIGYVDVPASLQ